jgi:small subunit ribosomal protein S8
MSVSDPIADMLTRIRNAVMNGQAMVAMPNSKLKVEIAKILKEEGFLEGMDVAEGERPGQMVLRIRIKYIGERRERRAVLTNLVRVSRPGRRVYTKKQDIPWVLSGYRRRDHLHAQGNYDRATRSPAWRGRRNTL